MSWSMSFFLVVSCDIFFEGVRAKKSEGKTLHSFVAGENEKPAHHDHGCLCEDRRTPIVLLYGTCRHKDYTNNYQTSCPMTMM
jgi:hypothetical protein